ncbi:hypothetical protein Rhow_008954 [Rhodococcus wratislaviensis]|uniref:ABM domain-containing protein n=1 Tax=Rhodococcus wratislaviensis TaxID=44752 RepID=A0A402CLV8_RHOWR|nr:putative quinol monooxygenase [Rhodococcus wratislaviensis]GCE44533.1 hypothetical protein Rhow_008954 [Rhodococcus wratislaviensis]
MLIVIGRAQAAPGRRGEFVTAARAVTDATRDDEGCRSYGFYADLSDENIIVGVEMWRERADLDSHMGHEHTRIFLGAFPDLVVGEPVVSVHEVL